jgi:hypothetical protein
MSNSFNAFAQDYNQKQQEVPMVEHEPKFDVTAAFKLRLTKLFE